MMRSGVRLGIDYGAVRIGVARSDPDGLLAMPVTTLSAGEAIVEDIRQIVAEYRVFEVFVGLPLAMSGKKGDAAFAAESFAKNLAVGIGPTPVRMVDERLSTVESSRSLAAAGRNTRRSRSVIDQVAAVTILQSALDTERRTDRPAGTAVETQGAS